MTRESVNKIVGIRRTAGHSAAPKGRMTVLQPEKLREWSY